uniref:Uncharacterized protein n=1 Tax=Avena sativa TaxID=4498 RepID=A0ACD5URV8_AVESA
MCTRQAGAVQTRIPCELTGVKENGEVVAVKKLNDMQGMDDKQFLNEVKVVMDISHPNIVRAAGYCYQIERELMPYNASHILVDKVYRLLCFEYLPNGSLDKHLTDESSGLDWHVCYNIIQGICNGLYCLHEGRPGEPILHLDLKPPNVLLDKHMIPKIADFGQSRLFGEGKTHCSTMNIVGTRGYMAPEYIDRGMLTKESDIYSLGVILMEILTGHRKHPENTTARELSEVKDKWRTRLQATLNRMSLEEECGQVNLCIKIGLKCMGRDPKRRPNIKEIIEILGLSENMSSHSVQENSSDVEEQTWEVVPLEWREALDILAFRSPEQSIKGMEVIFHELLRIFETESTVPQYIIKDADRLVSYLSAMAEKTSRLIFSGASSMSVVYFAGRYTITTLTQAFNIRHLALAVKASTVEILFRDLLIWSTVNKDGELSNLLKTLMRKIQGNAETISMLLALMSLLRPLDPARWPSCATHMSLEEKSHIYSELVAECLDEVAKDLPETIGELDLDRILSSIQVYLEELGVEEINRREETRDCGLVAVMDVLSELVYIRGTQIKDHHSMVRVDSDPQPIIMGYIDSFLEDIGGTSSSNPMVEGGAEVSIKKMGPWGGHSGVAHDMEVLPQRLLSVVVCTDGLVVYSIEFAYIDCDGQRRTAGPWGGEGPVRGSPHRIMLGPSEFLEQIDGTIDRIVQSDILTSIRFVTSTDSYGPFGRAVGIPFHSPAPGNGSIIGFFAAAAYKVDSIGVYVARKKNRN